MNPSQDVYRRLAKHLDDLPGGFPATESGVELRILQRLFTEEEAEMALHLTLIPEEARVVARRAGSGTEEVAEKLDAMARKGLVFSMEKSGSSPRYMAAQFVVGIWEYHVNDLDEELVRDVKEYIPHLEDLDAWDKAPQLRTVPVGRSIDVEHHILPHEQAEEIVRKQSKFLVAPCICRREHKILGEGCDRPEETCLVFGMGADYYERNGIGRVIDADEAVAIVRNADDAGLVLQPSNSQNILNICTCCGCCCEVLINLKRHPRPADIVSSPFIAAYAEDACAGCGACVDRCQMDAMSLANGKACFEPDRCIGCGLCVSTCPSDALALARKPEPLQKKVPRTFREAMYNLACARGKMGPAGVAAAVLKSKLDRLLAS